MKIALIAGGSGLIGTELSRHLTNNNYEVRILSRKPTNIENSIYNWDLIKRTIDPKAFEGVSTVINLTGSSIAGGRWTKKRKKELEDSRIDSSKLLVDTINNSETSVKHFIQASAMGYYGDSGDTILTEESLVGDDYMAKLCSDWEAASEHLNKKVNRTVMRIGLYLHKDGGVYSTLSKVSKFYLASAFGDGKMWANYTHKDELNDFVLSIAESKTPNGTYNVVGRSAFQMDAFISAIAKSQNRKVILPRIPAFLLKLALGEASAILLNSYRITSPKMKNQGLHKFDNLESALQAL